LECLKPRPVSRYPKTEATTLLKRRTYDPQFTRLLVLNPIFSLDHCTLFSSESYMHRRRVTCNWWRLRRGFYLVNWYWCCLPVFSRPSSGIQRCHFSFRYLDTGLVVSIPSTPGAKIPSNSSNML